MIDPILSLSFNLHAQRGAYALLIGSGVSRSAGIPTGWEVTLDLISKLAHLEQEDCRGKEADWYQGKFGKEPDYSEVLSALASTPAAQQQILKSYFEPSEEERGEGKKIPTAAHRSIAKLVSNGQVRVIVSTNFDRLLEAALEAEGIAPVVIATPDAAKGAPPLAHSKCTLIKVHGDYLDLRIKNSPEDLAKYDKGMDRLLDQAFDEYGLIICGWSGEYDTALRRALERSKTRRYPMYWTGISEPKGTGKDLIALHSAQFVKIDGADSFFGSIFEKIEALEEFERPHPFSTQAAVAALKKYLSEDKYRIQLRELLIGESEQTCLAIDASFGEIEGKQPAYDLAFDLIKRLEANCETLVHLFANGAFYAKPEQARSFFDAFQPIIAKSQVSGGYDIWIGLRKYPALLLAYAVGIAATASDNFSVLHEIASRSLSIKNDHDNGAPAPVRIYALNTMQRDHARQVIPDMDRRHAPLNDHLFEVLKEPMSRLIPDENLYELSFDNFEYLWCLLHVDGKKQQGKEDVWTPWGAFSYRRGEYSGEWYKDQVRNALDKSDQSWPPVKAGLFGGSVERLSETISEAQPKLDEISRNMY